MNAVIGQEAPNLEVADWLQGKPTNIDRERGRVVIVEVFQVNCPGCFLYGIPEMINIHHKYNNEGVRVLGVATAFEDFDKNTPDNLARLIRTGEVIGDTLKTLSQHGQLNGNMLRYGIPFPLGTDKLIEIKAIPTRKPS